MSAEQIIDQLNDEGKEVVRPDEVLSRAVDGVLPLRSTLLERMNRGPMTLYLGIDPTSPNLHIGHSVPLRKLEQFRSLGHKVILLFGTFTGMIGDPTDKSAARIRLTREQIAHNVASYAEQATKVLDIKNPKNPAEILFNDSWLGKMTFEDVVDLASNFSVDQLLERSMFKDRARDKKPVWTHELLYPLMQGYDSVAMKVDLEVGGSDQVFNMLVGRDLVKRYLNKEKWVMTTKLIEDPSGKKMGKTTGNIVGLGELPEIMYEGIMTWPDSAIPVGFELITSVPMELVRMISEASELKGVNPMILKMALAHRVVQELDGKDAASFAEQEFDRVMRKGELPKRMTTGTVEKNTTFVKALIDCGLCTDEKDALAKISGGAVYWNDTQVKKDGKIGTSKGILKLGRRTIKNLRLVDFA